MKDEVAAKRYAEGFLSFAKETIGLKNGYEEYRRSAQLIAANPELKKLLQNPEITLKEKSVVVDEVFGADFSEELRQFFKLLIQKRRIEEIYDISDYIQTSFYHAQGIEKGSIVSARPLSKETTLLIREKLERKLGKKLELETKIEPDLIGGIQARVGNKVIDGSVKRKLAQLKEHLMEIKVN